MSNPFDPFRWPRPPAPSKAITLRAFGAELEVRLTQLSLIDSHRMAALRDSMIARYIEAGHDFPPVGGLPVALNEETCEACATLAVMQTELSFEQLVALAATAPDQFIALAHTAAELNQATGKESRPPMP